MSLSQDGYTSHCVHKINTWESSAFIERYGASRTLHTTSSMDPPPEQARSVTSLLDLRMDRFCFAISTQANRHTDISQSLQEVSNLWWATMQNQGQQQGSKWHSTRDPQCGHGRVANSLPHNAASHDERAQVGKPRRMVAPQARRGGRPASQSPSFVLAQTC